MDSVWFSRTMGHPSTLRPFTNDLSSDEDRIIAIQRKNNAGEVLNDDEFPEGIWGCAERGAKTFGKLPDFFYGDGYWVVSEPCAEVLRQVNLGSGRLRSVKVFQKDRVTLIGDHDWFCLNFGNKKTCFVAEQSRSIKPFPQGRWIECGKIVDNDIAVSRQALDGPDIWIDPRLLDGLFLSDRLARALKKAKCASAFRLTKCRVIDDQLS